MARKRNKRQATPARTPTAPWPITSLDDDVLGIVYSNLESRQDRQSFYHAHPAFWKSQAINYHVQSLRLIDVTAGSLPQLAQQIESFPRHAAGLKSLSLASNYPICPWSGNLVLERILEHLCTAGVSTRAHLSIVQHLTLETWNLTKAGADAVLHLFISLHALGGGALALTKCTVSCEFLSTIGSHARLQKLVLDSCNFEGMGVAGWEQSLSSFQSLRELSLRGVEWRLLPVRVFKMAGMQQLRSLTLSNCLVIGLNAFLQAVPLHSLHLLGKCEWAGTDGRMNGEVPDRSEIASTTLQELHLKMDVEHSLLDFLQLPALAMLHLSSIDMANVSSAGMGQTQQDLNLMVSRLSTLQKELCIEDGFEVRISCGRHAQFAIHALLKLQHVLSGRRMIVVAETISAKMINTLSKLAKAVQNIELKVHGLADDAMVRSVKVIKNLSVMDLRVTHKPPEAAIAALLAASERKRPFTLRLRCEEPDSEESDFDGYFDDDMETRARDMCWELQRQWSRIQRDLPRLGIASIPLDVC